MSNTTSYLALFYLIYSHVTIFFLKRKIMLTWKGAARFPFKCCRLRCNTNASGSITTAIAAKNPTTARFNTFSKMRLILKQCFPYIQNSLIQLSRNIIQFQTDVAISKLQITHYQQFNVNFQ